MYCKSCFIHTYASVCQVTKMFTNYIIFGSHGKDFICTHELVCVCDCHSVNALKGKWLVLSCQSWYG